MPSEEPLNSRWVALPVASATILGGPGVRVRCGACGEEVLNDRQVVTANGPLCRGCVGDLKRRGETSRLPLALAYPRSGHRV
jgi:formylmethanofuran dehydrogenase subunit E